MMAPSPYYSTGWKRRNPVANRAHARKNFRSFAGKASHIYANMRQRVAGKGKSPHIYKGLELLARDEFIGWALASKEYATLYAVWVESNFDIKFAPSIDRIDSKKGYALPNMQWITHSQNSRKAAMLRHHGIA